MADVVTYPPLHKTVTVPWAPDAAFRRFTEQMSSWWPYRSHSVGGKDVDHIVFDGRVGGEIYEVHRGGARHVWGTVKAWQPPARVAFTWHPGQDPSTHQDIEVKFSAVPGGTRLELIHTGWERLGKMAKAARRGYPIGWEYVLLIYADRRYSPVVLAIGALAKIIGAVQALFRRAHWGPPGAQPPHSSGPEDRRLV